MVPADDDRRLHLAGAHELVEDATRAGALAVAEPADSRRQPLEVDALGRGLEPAHQRRVAGELLEEGAVGGGDVRGLA